MLSITIYYEKTTGDKLGINSPNKSLHSSTDNINSFMLLSLAI
ncbi:hypothetical protein [Anabaena sp. PCC 7108]|nr:hypothetical protein [Anabaena sp. PCC 7108]